jgi:hypothetical protein
VINLRVCVATYLGKIPAGFDFQSIVDEIEQENKARTSSQRKSLTSETLEDTMKIKINEKNEKYSEQLSLMFRACGVVYVLIYICLWLMMAIY